MPGGQYTNLKEQARSVGLDDSRWPEVAQAYADVNQMFGDIVKVTPSSKVIGDLALLMVSSGLTKDQVLDPEVEVAFPESVVQMLRGDLGQPAGGWPPALQKKVLKDVQAADYPPRRGHGAAGSGCGAQEAGREVRARRDRHAVRLVSHVSQGVPRLRARPCGLRRLRHPAHAGVLLRHGPGRRSLGRHRTRQDADRALRGGIRSARRWHAAGVLRTERPAALHHRDRPFAGREASATAQDGSRATPNTSVRPCRAPSPP